MDSENKKAPRIKTDRNKAIAMTRAFDMLSEEFIENFQQTGKDAGPDGKPKPSPVREALAAREKREAEEENKKTEEKQEFRGFASLMANANKPAAKSAFARLLGDEAEEQALPAAPPPQQGAGPEPTHAAPGREATADGGLIKVKDTVGKKRGLYTSCMQKPTTEQWQEMAEKYGKKDAAATAADPAPAPINYSESVANIAQAQWQAPAPQAPQAPAQPQINQAPAPGADSPSPFAPPASPSPFPFAPPAFSSPSPSSSSPSPSSPPQAQQAQSQAQTPSPYSLEAVQAYAAASRNKDGQSQSASCADPVQHDQAEGEEHRPAASRAKMTYDSECPMACGMSQFKDWWQKTVGWIKGKVGR